LKSRNDVIVTGYVDRPEEFSRCSRKSIASFIDSPKGQLPPFERPRLP